jgi:hypothetical protein
MGGMLMAIASGFAKGCLPCVVPYRATGLSSQRIASSYEVAILGLSLLGVKSTHDLTRAVMLGSSRVWQLFSLLGIRTLHAG